MPARTKSCAICRMKRIKCDATSPQCLMCVRYGRQCPGLADGPLIVDMTETARHGMRKRRPKNTSRGMISYIGTDPYNGPIEQISQQTSVTEAFYARFLSYWTSEGDGKDIQNKTSWLHRLPLIAADGTNNALMLALQAAASSFCAAETKDRSLARHAWDLYGRAVRSHCHFLARSHAGKDGITVHMISTSVLFSFFEAMQATNAGAYRSHIYGAAKMFEITDPKQCSEGVLCQIFYHLRTQLAFVQLTSGGRELPVAIQTILYHALQYEELPMFQRLTTHFTTLAGNYSKADFKAKEGDDIQTADIVEHGAIQGGLDTLWQEYNKAAGYNDEIISWRDRTTNVMLYRDAFTALTVAYFSASRVLLAILAPQRTISYHNPTDHHQSILDAALYLQTYQIGCAFMRIAAPLLIVAIHAPTLEQRRTATSYFEVWGTGSMQGISALALDLIYARTTGKSTPCLTPIGKTMLVGG